LRLSKRKLRLADADDRTRIALARSFGVAGNAD
jgi:hypothetical protein